MVDKWRLRSFSDVQDHIAAAHKTYKLIPNLNLRTLEIKHPILCYLMAETASKPLWNLRSWLNMVYFSAPTMVNHSSPGVVSLNLNLFF
jgi:hypothetical protein